MISQSEARAALRKHHRQELGKALAGRIAPELESRDEPTLRHDSSTNALIRLYRCLRDGA